MTNEIINHIKKKKVMRFFLSIVFISISTMSYSQHKYVLKVKGGTDAALNLQDVTNSGNSTTKKISVANLNLTNLPIYTNQDSAVRHGLINGDVYKLPAQESGNSILAIVDTLLPDGFNYTVDNSEGESHPGFQIANHDSTHFNLTVDWGDGNAETHTNFANYICTHTYSTNNIFTIRITVNDISIPTILAINNDFTGDGNEMTSISNLSKLINLKWLYMERNRLSPALIDSIKLPAGLTDLGLGGNYLGNYNPVNLPSTLVYLDLDNNDLTSLLLDNLPAHLRFCDFHNNKFSSSEVNNILMHFDNSGVTEGQLFLIDQTPGAPPGGDGLTAKSSLELKEWEVTTD